MYKWTHRAMFIEQKIITISSYCCSRHVHFVFEYKIFPSLRWTDVLYFLWFVSYYISHLFFSRQLFAIRYIETIFLYIFCHQMSWYKMTLCLKTPKTCTDIAHCEKNAVRCYSSETITMETRNFCYFKGFFNLFIPEKNSDAPF